MWNLQVFKSKLTFSGFADFWRENNTCYSKHSIVPVNTKFVFMTEPQLWYNINEHLALGSEIETACNFGAVKGLKICPTAAVKWTF